MDFPTDSSVESSAIAESLGRTGLCVYPGYCAPQECLELREDLEQLRVSGGFKRAATGQGKGKEVRDLVRSDEIHWLDRAQPSPAQAMLWRKLDSLSLALNRMLFLGLTDFEGHYAVYPDGGYYRRHLDCFKLDDARVVSVILYLNPDWSAADGGQLRVYHANSHTDVEPRDGTLVCFLSRESEHEVLASHAPRHSFSGWFKSSSSTLRVSR